MSPHALIAVAVLLAGEAPAPPSWALERHTTPPALAPGGRARVRVELTNLGGETWSDAQGDRLAYHWLDARGDLVVRDGERTPLPAPLAPGETLALDAELVAPAAAGRYTLQWSPVRENRFWYPAPARGDAAIAVDVGPAPRSWSLEPLAVPRDLPAGARATARVRLCNHGASAWSSALADALSYRWLDREGRVVEGLRTALPAPLDAGACVSLRADLLAPDAPGPYTLAWEPVRDGVAWYGEPARGEPSVDLAVGPARDAFAVIAADLPELRAGLPAEAALTLWNRGAETWSPGHGLRVSYVWLDDAGRATEGARTELPEPVAPGDLVELAARVRPPDRPGDYTLAWRLVREGEAWISPAHDAPRPVRVGPPALAWELQGVAWPASLHAGEPDLVRVTVRNTGSEPWSPAAGDRLSYHWRATAGATLAHDGLRTELPGPVAPGDTLELDLRVAGPARAGEYRLELGMVREQVAWFTAPTGAPAEHVLPVTWRSTRWQLLLLLGTLLAVLVARRARPSPGAPAWAALTLAPAAWLWLACAVSAATFAEMAGIDPWQGGRAASLSSAAVPALLVLLAPARLRPALAFLLSLGTAVLLLADLLYMQVLGAIVPVQGLVGAHQLGDIGASVRALLRPEYAWLAAAPLAGLALACAWPRPPADAPAPARARRLALAAALLAALLACLPIARALHDAMTGLLGVRVFSEQHNVGRFGVLGAHLFDLARTTRELLGRRELAPERRADVDAFFAARPAAPGPGFGLARGANLLVVQAEALQGWVIGATVEGQEITPFLNGLRRRALYYSGVVDITAQGMTSDAEYAVLSAHYPLSQGALAWLRAGNSFVTAAHALQRAGYSTLSAHPFRRGFWNRAALHPRYGFERSLFDEELGPGPTIGWGLADDAFFARVLPELAAAPKPFFAFLITLSLHHPYDEFPPALRRLDLGALEGTSLGNYLHGIHHLDAALARLFAGLDASGLQDSTAVAIYGDHDCRLGPLPEIAALAGEPAGSPSLALRLERIPAFLVLPGGQPAREVDVVGSHVDLAPTWLHYLGVPAPRAFLGRPLLADDPGPHTAALADGSAVGDDLLFVAAGPDIPPEGACFARDGRARLPRAACDDLVARARRELDISHAVLDHDLARELAASDVPGATSPAER